ncbi:polysaccharide deacetylase [Vairimorpha apis BRL 01]|uniref:Polysaccharide deacetylase n=1 Tax=Vairimorpha apis BRL 01 TaxID=1037528 RepID=T0MI69_9MICR|nr:polysaccharide deacetylase [Vairimorpha apis BRL 01]
MIFFSYLLNIRTGLQENCTNGGLIAITFDDGPTKYTNTILDIAQDKDVPLTFHFTVHEKYRGNLATIYRRAADEGHTVGLRVNPKRNYDEMEFDDVKDDIERQLTALADVTNTDIKYARAPVDDGSYNEAVYETFAGNNIVQSSYNFRPYDIEGNPIEEWKSMLKLANPKYESFIVQLHDEREQEDAYLEDIIDIGKEFGFTFVTLDDCLGDFKPDNIPIDKKSKLSSDGVTDINISYIFLLVLYAF